MLKLEDLLVTVEEIYSRSPDVEIIFLGDFNLPAIAYFLK